MKLPRLFKLPTYKKFEYKPRTFDARKEAIRQRQKRRKEELKELDSNKGDIVENENQKQRSTYLRERFSEYKNNTSRKSNIFMNIALPMMILGILFTAFFGIGQLYLDMKNEKIVWNDLLSYAVMLICITYFLIRYNKRQQKN